MNEHDDKRKSLIKAISAIYRYSQTYIGRNIRDYRIGQGQWAFLTQLLFNYDGITQEELSEVFKGLNRILAKDFTDDERETARRLLYKMFDNIAAYERSHR